MQNQNIKNVKIGTECVDKELLELVELLKILLDKRDIDTVKRMTEEFGNYQTEGNQPFPQKTYLFYEGWNDLREVTRDVYSYLFAIKYMKREAIPEAYQISEIERKMDYIKKYRTSGKLASKQSFPDKFKVIKSKVKSNIGDGARNYD